MGDEVSIATEVRYGNTRRELTQQDITGKNRCHVIQYSSKLNLNYLDQPFTSDFKKNA